MIIPAAASRRTDLACLGRLAVDLYGQQIGASLETTTSFARYLGGSAANIAFGAARLGLRSAMISRVGDEQMGRYLLDTLAREGCDTSQVQVDPQRLTALALLAVRSREDFPLLFYRENCADMALDAEAIDPAFIAGCRALLCTGTHLSTPEVQAASLTALSHAARHGVLRVLDIDYRPVLWGLTLRGDGANRYVADAAVTRRLQAVLRQFDVLIGTAEEFHIAGGVPDDLPASLRAVRALTPAVLVVKLGAAGCAVIEGDVPPRLSDFALVPGEPVEVLNVVGAGDAFAAGFLAALLRGQSWQEAARLGNACGAIVVSRHACSAAMPTPAELAHFLATPRRPREDEDPVLAHLHRTTAARTEWPEVMVLAFDHRVPFEDLARQAGAALDRVPVLKRLLVEAVASSERVDGSARRFGVLLDDADALTLANGRGWWIGRPVERTGSRPLRFDGTRSIATWLHHWPAEHVVKVLVQDHPDDPLLLRLDQESRLKELWEATRDSGHEVLVELLPPPAAGPPDDDAVLRSIERLYHLGLKPEWWKLAPMRRAGWRRLAEVVGDNDPTCRGALILGLQQPVSALVEAFGEATDPIVKGFAIGRSLWAAPALRWLRGELDDAAVVADVASNFTRLIDAWALSRAASAHTS